MNILMHYYWWEVCIGEAGSRFK